MAQLNFGGTTETVVIRDEFPLEKAREVLKNETIAVIGYGVQGPGQALNLRDNGFNVIVGQRPGKTYDKAVADGWVPGETLFGIEEACEKGTVVMCLLSDAAVMSVWPTIKPYLTAGKALYFSHGFAITWSDRTGVVPPKDIDVIMVAPKGSGTSLRTMFLEGRGLNSSYAIYQDATGNAMDRTIALGIGIGSGYLFETTFSREATSDLTGERGSLMGAIQGLLLAQYEVLRENGHSPSEAFNETVEELTQSLMPLFAKNGMDWMYANCSTTAQRGALDWMGPFHDAIKPVVEKFGIGIDVIHIDGWQRQDMSGVWEWDTERFPEPEEMIRELNKKNIHLSLWNYPYLQEDSPAFKELAERGFFIKNKEGHPAMFKATADSEFLCACFDFTNPEFLAWYEERVKKIVRMGVSVIKTDFSEAVPEDVVFYNGMSGREGHNLLTYLYAKNIYTWMKEICDEHGELPMLWGRSGYVGSHTIPAAWAGDSSSDKASHSAILQAGLGMAMSGVSFWGYDLGGFYNTGYIGNEERPNIEDYLSSVQMGLWMPLSRAHGKTPREPWQYGDMALKEVKKWINFRHRLVPYLYHTACQTHQSGIPMIRPLVMEYPKDPIAKTQNLSYMLGDALLISPGFDRDEYELYLPEGRWQDIESKEVYEGMTFVHIENKAFADGGTSLRVFQKEGTSIPLFAQKEVLHVPAQLWKQEDLEFMTFQKKMLISYCAQNRCIKI